MAVFGTSVRKPAAPLAVAMMIAFGLSLQAGPARAQNLVQNPNFADGLTGYSGYGVTTTTYNGQTAAYIVGFANYVETFATPTVPGQEYIFTFLAAAQDPQVATSLVGVFGTQGQPEIFETLTSTGFNQFTLTGTANSTNTLALVQSLGDGGFYVTSFDVEPAPAPVTGGGIASLCVGLVGLGVHRARRGQRGRRALS